MSLTVQPIPSALGDAFFWESTATIASNAQGQNTSNGGRIQVASDAFFLLQGFLASTNYDQSAGDFIAVVGASPGAAARQLVTPPLIANNFSVKIKLNSDIDLMGDWMPQACLCSNGYRSGPQLVFPSLFEPMTTFDFEFMNTAQTLVTAADNATVLSLAITFAVYGYFVPVEQLSNFLATFPAYGRQARKGQAGWLQQFTSLQLPVGV